jgi:hypothetical protein
MRKPNISRREKERRPGQSWSAIQQRVPQLKGRWVTGSTLSKILNISSVTLWRWRHAGGFPLAKRINGRLYFPWDEVADWVNKQQDAA